MKTLIIVGILIWQTNVFAQGSFVYRNGAEVTSGNSIDLNLDGTTDFVLSHPWVGLGDLLIQLRSLAPFGDANFPPNYSTEIMSSTLMGGGIDWTGGEPILADPGSTARWTTTALNMQHMLVAFRLRDGEDWNYGWMRFETIREDQFGERWGLRDAAYNSIPNAPINMLQVPEPSTALLLLIGGTLVGMGRYRRSTK